MLRATLTAWSGQVSIHLKSTAPSASLVSTESSRALYNKATAYIAETSHLQGIQNLLQWDQQVMMPPKAAAFRAKQSALLAAIVHERRTNPQFASWVEELASRQDVIQSSSLTSSTTDEEFNIFERANMRQFIKAYRAEAALPTDLVKEGAALASEGIDVWAEARKQSNFELLVPILQRWINYSREVARIKIAAGVVPEATKIHREALRSLSTEDKSDCKAGFYQALMDDYEPGLSVFKLEELFSTLKASLIPLIEQIKAKSLEHDYSCIAGNFDQDKQKQFSHRIAKELGFDTNAGRLDVSTHPFSGGADPTDVRMTTRYTTNFMSEGIMSTIHETGHSLYEQGRNKKYLEQPVSQALSLGIHESQSLLWERMVGLGKPFWTYTLPILKQHFPSHKALQASNVDTIYLAFNRVCPGFIRVEADEVTYPLHVILRFEIERDLIEGHLQVHDIPHVWNNKMKEYLGLDVPNDRLGCLQDVHWSSGAWGYFPTYVLGSIYAVQIFDAAKEHIPNLEDHLARGEFQVLKAYLNEHIHIKGSVPESGDHLMQELTGMSLSSTRFVAYLIEKYSKIYNLQ